MAVGGRQPESGHHVGEQPGVHAVRVARAVLVVLDGDERRLRRPVQPGDHPGLRVGLLEVVERAVRDVLAQLPELAVAAQVPRRAPRPRRARRAARRARAWRRRRCRRRAARPRAGPARTRARSRGAARAGPELPLAVVRDAGEAAVVQLVAAVEGELEVVAVGVGVGGVGAQGRLAAQRGEHRGRERPPGARQRRWVNARRCGAAEHGSPRRPGRVVPGRPDLAAVAGVAEGRRAAAPAHAQRGDRSVRAHAAAVREDDLDGTGDQHRAVRRDDDLAGLARVIHHAVPPPRPAPRDAARARRTRAPRAATRASA